MKSYANVKSHPVHPALIPFPFAFLLGALLFDAAGWWTERVEWTFTGMHLVEAGLVAGLVAAVPGVLDYWKRVPPKSSAQKRAFSHGLANVAALVLFTSSWFLRRADGLTPVALAVEVVGAGALVYAGWLGGILVTRNLISVDHRHANAGKWQEARYTAAAGKPVVVGRVGDLEENQMKLLVINGVRVVLARTRDGYTAFQDGCTHRGGSLADGACIDGFVQCLWHGSQFDTSTGEVHCGPAKKKIEIYDVKQQKDDIVIVSAPA
jgi:nitrite reductase/ring-hydroxylating ferredoxin subunit/uncharacterized membrane protein